MLTVLPFGNVVATAPVDGAQLKAMLENGVSTATNSAAPFGLQANGWFPQVSGLCFTYNIEAASGSRVTSAVRPGLGGSCTIGTTPIDLTAAGGPYTIAINDFMAMGGDGYLNLVSSLNTPAIKTMDEVLAGYITANTPISPAIQARIHCVDPNPGSGAACTTGSP